MTGLSDSFQRPIDYLRISVTDRCNLRCVYCMPKEGLSLMPHSEILSYEEIYAIVAAAAELGISKVRLTGGEPLVRLDLPQLVRMLAQIRGIDDLSLTTNGVLLSRYAAELKEAGLRRVNVSLDTLRSDRFLSITRHARLDDVLDGIHAAQAAGLLPVKINVVVMRGMNEDEVLDFARLTRGEDWHVRFIELMPFGQECGSSTQEMTTGSFVPVQQIWDSLATLGALQPCLPSIGNGPASYFRLPGATGTIGFISPVSEHICFGCNRLRLTADGHLRPCLLSDHEIDLKAPLRAGASLEELKQLITQAVAAKPERHHLADGIAPAERHMAQIGG